MKQITQLYYIWVLVTLCGFNSYSQSLQKKQIYVIPGQGSDYRLYKNLTLDTSKFDIHYITWQIPNKHEDLPSFAKRLSAQIDTTQEFYIIGVSLGGMVATEINDILNPKKVFIISSAKCRAELPFQYRFQKYVPLYSIIPKRFIKMSAFIAQPLFEPDRKLEKETCVAMLKDKNPLFLKRTVRMIIKWNRTSYDSTIVHIHGNNDHTLPIKNIHYNFLIENGSHMMILTRTSEIQKIIKGFLEEKI